MFCCADEEATGRDGTPMEIGGWYAFGSEGWPGKLLETCRFNRSEDASISHRHVPTVTRSKRYLKREEI